MWEREEILVTVRAFPNPSKSHQGLSCVVGFRLGDKAWNRLHPIPYQLVPNEQQFRKYDVLSAQVHRSRDHRPESHWMNLDATIQRTCKLDTKRKWEA